ncbi:MAG: DUF4097 family beta strand repeat protein [Acidobacteria bacterium]|nr:DUF4097 family beta strand repeat protein [Acidobacteriota bacterium]
MRWLIALTGILLAVCPPAVAQGTGERVVVPARNSTRPRKVDVKMTNGSLTVKAYSGAEVIVETERAARHDHAVESGGMHRIDLPRTLTVEEQDNVISVRPGISSGGLVISVPADTSLSARNTNGPIAVDGLRGEIDVESNNGAITLNHVSGTVVAHSLNGAIRAAMDRVDASRPISFSTLNGAIDVTLPADVRANVKLSTHRGEVWSDFDIKLGAGPVTTRSNTADGRYRVSMDRSITGTINGGGADASFYTLNGKITIRKK